MRRLMILLAALGTVAHADPLPANLAQTATPGVDPKAPCSAPVYHALDLWLGDWQVFDAKSGKQVGTDHVTADYGHCVIRQQMRFAGQMYRHPGTPFALAGTSISRFDGQQWLQLWADNQWGAIVLKGNTRADGGFELNSVLPSRGRDMRLVWVQQPDGLHIEQYGAKAGSGEYERYPDLLYRRVKPKRR
jgi:hypothetical protein